MTALVVPTTKTVIVADDTAFVRDRFATALLSAGHTAYTVKSAAELLARVRADLARIDLIVLDLMLPEIDRALFPERHAGEEREEATDAADAAPADAEPAIEEAAETATPAEAGTGEAE